MLWRTFILRFFLLIVCLFDFGPVISIVCLTALIAPSVCLCVHVFLFWVTILRIYYHRLLQCKEEEEREKNYYAIVTISLAVAAAATIAFYI